MWYVCGMCVVLMQYVVSMLLPGVYGMCVVCVRYVCGMYVVFMWYVCGMRYLCYYQV